MSSVFAPGRVAIVTGAAGGIGISVVTRCSNHGMRVCLLDVNDEALAQARAKILTNGGSEDRVMTMRCDVSKEGDYNQARDRVVENWGDD